VTHSGLAGTAAAPIGEIRAWAVLNGYDVAAEGRLRAEIRAAYETAHPRR